MRQLPALFSTPMVKAILENRKTMTRRTKGLSELNMLPDTVFLSGTQHTANSKDIAFIFKPCIDVMDIGSIIVKPQYQIGDQIYVKESYYAYGYWKIDGKTKTGKEKLKFIDCTSKCFYKYDYYPNIPETVEFDRSQEGWWKRNSLFMPKKAARIWLECTGVRCERLQSISSNDCISEGILPLKNGASFDCHTQKYFDYSKPKQHFPEGLDPFWSFNSLWCSINGGESWDANPWVFVYEFKRIEKP